MTIVESFDSCRIPLEKGHSSALHVFMAALDFYLAMHVAGYRNVAIFFKHLEQVLPQSLQPR